MPFIRQTRDKRGFEHTYVMHTGRPGPGSQRPRVLYVFRSPANLRVGRQSLDPEVREALEHTHPDLSFDWNALTREAVVVRPEAPPQRPQKPNRPRVPEPAQPPAPPPQIEDSSLLGKVVGPATSIRIRARYAELSQRIVRRARTPEERDALLEKMRTLNPDDWADEETIRARIGSIDRDLDRLSAEVPSRRRGRRGGRHRHENVRTQGETSPSGIMANGDERHEEQAFADDDRAVPGGSDAGDSPADPAAGLPDDD